MVTPRLCCFVAVVLQVPAAAAQQATEALADADPDGVRMSYAPVDDDHIRLEIAGHPPTLASIIQRADVNADALDDYVLVRGETDQDGSFNPSCGNYSECEIGLLVRDDVLNGVLMIPFEYRFGLSVADSSSSVEGVAWRDVVESTRVSGSQAAEAALMERGLDPVLPLVWHRRPELGYQPGRRGPWGLNDECARARVERRLTDARRFCDLALRNAVATGNLDTGERAPSRELRAIRNLRGAILYNLGRLAEDDGDLAAARSYYVRSLAERPDHRAVQARLDALERR